MLIDSHCHLDYPALALDRKGVLERARNASIARMINIATTKKDFEDVRKTAEQFEDVFCSVGIHPHHVSDEGEHFETDELVALASHPKVVGIGETGLDFYYEHAPRQEQEESFRRHIRAGITSDLPIIVHSRDAEIETVRVLREEGEASPRKPRGVLHCFSSGRALSDGALPLGFYVSLSGILTFKKSEELRSIVKEIPLDRLLIETDAPFLAPEPLRGKVCEPAFVVHTARVLAQIKGVSEADIARQTTENFFCLFNKVTPLG